MHIIAFLYMERKRNKGCGNGKEAKLCNRKNARALEKAVQAAAEMNPKVQWIEEK